MSARGTPIGAVVLLVVGLAFLLGVARGGEAATRPKSGKALFVAACGSCHTLPAAGTKGRIGPNLAEESGTYREIVSKVRRGDDGMPSFAKTLTASQISRIATFVGAATRRAGDD